MEQSMFVRLGAIAPTLIMRDNPQLPQAPDICLSRTKAPDDCTWKLHDLDSKPSYPMTTTAELPNNTRVIDLNDKICPGGLCRAVTGGKVLMFDEHHLTDSFSSTLTNEFKRLLKESVKDD